MEPRQIIEAIASRGIVTVPHKRRVLFSGQIDLTLEVFVKRKPHVFVNETRF